jgi:hypothetical protein
MPLIGEIPGLAEAVEREAFDRLAAFVPVHERITNIPVRMLTPRLTLELEAAGSPFLKGRLPSAPDVTAFLWHVSVARIEPRSWWIPEQRFRELRKQACIRQWVHLPYVQTALEIQKYIEDANADGPGGGSSYTDTPFASWASGIVDYVASRYHWDEDKILDTPLKRLWQYWRRAMMRETKGEATFINRADAAKGAFLESLNQPKPDATK